MILLFPDLDTVRLALTSGLVSADVTLAPAAVSTDDQGRLYVEPSVSLSKTTGKILDRLGVKGSKRHGGEAVREVGSWVELVPLVKEPGTPEVASGAAVLFELPSADDLPAIVTEMLRLGNDRQGFRWFAGADEADAKRVLLRVIGPPYYTLLRALDRPAGGGVRAYLERAPRVWVELGWNHPLAAQIKVAEGQFALLTAPANWHFLDDAPFRDVYDLAQFPLPSAPVAWEPAAAPEVVTVPLRLTAGNAADPAELWVLRDDPVGQLDALVRDADERLTQRLMFAVATAADGSPVAVLRTRPSKLPPPALALENAAAFKPYWKLPNLFLPVGRRLHPTLRRDAVRRLLADDPDQVVWLYPDGKSGFTPESIPDAAFRSLEDWVDYVIEAEQAALAAWVGATRFDFDHFVCPEGGPKPKPDRPDKEPNPKDDANPGPSGKADTGKTKPTGRTKTTKADAAEYVPPAPEAVAPNEWRVRAKELEDTFLAVEGSLDALARAALWPDLAAAYTGAGDAASDAAVCWLNALWEKADPPAAWATAWAKAEFPHLSGSVGAADLDAKLKSHTPSVADARGVVAGFLAASAGGPVPSWLTTRLPAIQKYLEAHEGVLPVRAAWLAAVRLARLAGGDPLGLARARDRMLERLFHDGLKAERDLPAFLRYAGHHDADRIRVVRDKALIIHNAARDWVGQHTSTRAFVDLFFAFAFARLGETSVAKELLSRASESLILPSPDDWQDDANFEAVVRSVSSNFLFTAFKYRIEAALAGKPHVGPFAHDILDLHDDISKKGKDEIRRGHGQRSDNPYRRAEMVIAKMREVSQILDPEGGRDPYTPYNMQFSEPLRKELLALPQIRDTAKLIDRIRKLAREGFPGKQLSEVQFNLCHEALALAARIGENPTTELLRLVPQILSEFTSRPGAGESIDVTKRQYELVQRSVLASAHFGRTDLLQPIVTAFSALVRSRPEDVRYKLVNAVTGSFLRGLTRLGLRDELDRFLNRLQSDVLKGTTPTELHVRYTGKPDSWAGALQTLLSLAAGRMTLGMSAQAVPTLDEARKELFATPPTRLPAKPLSEVLRSYLTALGHGPVELGLPRIHEVFTRLDSGALPSNSTWNVAFLLYQIRAVEAAVLAIVSDEFALGPTGKKWLDEDEYIIRKRVHADMARERDRGGV